MRYRRATTNVIATMLIFIIMISAMGLLYSRISPTIFGFEASTQANNQEFVMYSVASAVTDLVSSAEDTQNRVKIISKDAIYSVNNGHSLSIDVLDGNSVSLANLAGVSLGSFTANVSASFQGRSGVNYFGKIFDETTFINTNISESFTFVSKVNYEQDQAKFSLYFRTRMHVSDQLPNGEYDITFIIVKLIVQANYFPVTLEEWSLRLRRLNAVVTPTTRINVVGPLNITQSVDGVEKTPIIIPLDGVDINFKFVEIPILLTI